MNLGKKIPAGGDDKFVRGVEHSIHAHALVDENDRILVAVSGGPDSVALLYALDRLARTWPFDLAVAHLNHGLRQEADQEARLVRDLAETLGWPYHEERQDVAKVARQRKLSLEDAGRRCRYAFFEAIARKHNLNKVALAHHRDDNAELLLMFLFRGSGASGLAGIAPKRRLRPNEPLEIIRPLIDLSKAEIKSFLSTHRYTYCEDQSNQDITFLRNRIRHRLLPLLQREYNPNIVATLCRTASILSAENKWLEETTDGAFTQACQSIAANKIELSLDALADLHPALQRRVLRSAIARLKGDLKRLSRRHISACLALVNTHGQQVKQQHLPDQILVERCTPVLRLTRSQTPLRKLMSGSKTTARNTAPHYTYLLDRPDREAAILYIKEIDARLELALLDADALPPWGEAGHGVAFFDMHGLLFPLTVRHVKPEDRFQPLGMRGTQCVRAFLSKQKIPLHQRRRYPVILSGDRIIAVAGSRIDEKAKTGPLTRQVLKITLTLA